jgi:hypothetical protein
VLQDQHFYLRPRADRPGLWSADGWVGL